MLLNKLADLTYRYRLLLSLVALTAIVYFITFSWIFLPAPSYFLEWDTNSVTLRVEAERLGTDYSTYFRDGDTIVAIDGRPVTYGDRIFVTPVKEIYNLAIERDGQVLTQAVTVPPLQERTLVDYEIPVIFAHFIGLILWFIGFLTVVFAREKQTPAILIGIGFQFLAAFLLSPGPAKFGAPGAMLLGRLLFYLLPSFTFLLALAPYNDTLKAVPLRFLSFLFAIGLVFGALATIDLLLGVSNSSMWLLVGIDPIQLQAFVAAFSLVGSVALLLWRVLRSPRKSYHRQQLIILLTLLIIAVVPTILFVILPGNANTAVPYSLAYSMFLLAPIGYFFVLHRSGHLQLDLVVSRIITAALLILAFSFAYATLALFADAIFPSSQETIPETAPLILVLILATVGQRKVRSFVDALIYGQEEIGLEALRKAAAQIAESPEPTTIAELIADIGTRFAITRIVVLGAIPGGFRIIAAIGELEPFSIQDDAAPNTPILRQIDSDSFAGFPVWVDVVLPIMVREELLGLFLLGRPTTGLLHSRQILRLQELADVLAYGLQVINLVAATQSLSAQVIFEKELQRQRIATELHNEPLQTLGYVTSMLSSDASDRRVHEATQMLRQVTKDLRGIMIDLRPSALNKSLETMIRHVARSFGEQQSQLEVTCDVRVESEVVPTEQSRLAAFYILEEALNNVVKHAQARWVTIEALVENGILHLSILDDGIGVGSKLSSDNLLVKESHFGVAVMRRWAQIGLGELIIKDRPGGGTAVRATLQLGNVKQQEAMKLPTEAPSS